MKYSLILIKRMLEDLIIFPFILWGKWKARKQPLNKTYEVFFFFPFSPFPLSFASSLSFLPFLFSFLAMHEIH